MKPDRAIFQAAVERAGCRPEECFFTDDIAAYVEGARSLGIDAVQFESREQLEREMEARGMMPWPPGERVPEGLHPKNDRASRRADARSTKNL